MQLGDTVYSNILETVLDELDEDFTPVLRVHLGDVWPFAIPVFIASVMVFVMWVRSRPWTPTRKLAVSLAASIASLFILLPLTQGILVLILRQFPYHQFGVWAITITAVLVAPLLLMSYVLFKRRVTKVPS